PLVERLLPQGRRDGALAGQGELDRQRPGLEDRRQVLRRADREVAGDLRALATVDPAGIVGEVDDRAREDLVVENDREVLRVVLGRGRGDGARWRGGVTALGDRLGDRREGGP